MTERTTTEQRFAQFVSDAHLQDRVEQVRMKKLVSDYKAALDQLNGTIDDYLAMQVSAGSVTIEREPLLITEKGHNEYMVDRLTVRIGSRVEITFKPVGADIIGAFGRVDVNGAAGDRRLCLVDRTVSGGPKKWAEPRWVVAGGGKGRAITFSLLRKDSFFTMLMAVGDSSA
jgi:hypothetical protein